jgi:hypothetical protein
MLAALKTMKRPREGSSHYSNDNELSDSETLSSETQQMIVHQNPSTLVLTLEEHIVFLQSQIVDLKDIVMKLNAELADLKKTPAHQGLPISTNENLTPQNQNHVKSMKHQLHPAESWKKVQSKKLMKKKSNEEKMMMNSLSETPSPEPLKSHPMTQKPKSSSSIGQAHQPYLMAAKRSIPQKLHQTDRFKSALKKETSIDKKIKLIIKQPLPEEKIVNEISSIVLTTNFSTKARTSPILAWKILVKSWTDHYPLMISIINPNTAEIFYDSRQESKLLSNLLPTVKVIQREVGYSDISRRAKLYLTGYFKNLRLSALKDFSPHQKSQVLMRAQEIIPKLMKDPALAKRWKKTILFDVKDQNLPQFPVEEQMM